MPGMTDSLAGVPARLRGRIKLELVVLALATVVFLLCAPKNTLLYTVLAVLFLIYIALGARFTYRVIWSSRVSDSLSAWKYTAAWTAPVLLGFVAMVIVQKSDVKPVDIAFVLPAYFLWALVQQTLFQFYLLGRLRVIFSHWPAWLLCGVNGLAYGLVHFPDYRLILLTVPAGFLWSYCYLRFRALLPLACSHACLAVGYYASVHGSGLLTRWTGELARISQ